MANSDCQTCGTCGTGGGSLPLPGDPSNHSLITATPAFGGIDVEWVFPSSNPHAVAQTFLIRGTSPHFENANRRFVVGGNFFHDRVADGITYYYWLQILTINGNYLEPIGPASAQAKPLIEDMIELLTGEIDRGILAQALKNELDQISIINSNLLNEITAREDSSITLAQALQDVQNGIAQALTFITTEINSRTTADSALAEQITLVGSTLGDEYAAVIQTMQTAINTIDGTVSALWTAQVNVNGMIGGFGLVGTGQSVEAGFDVDRFWVGRTNGTSRRKPFIIDGNTVYIDEAAINKLTFSKLRDEAGSFIVQNGRIQAAYIRVNSASIDDASITNAKIGGSLFSANFVNGVSGWFLGQDGYLQANNIYARGDIQATSLTANTVTAQNVVSDSLTKFYSTQGGSIVVSSSLPVRCMVLDIWVNPVNYDWKLGVESWPVVVVRINDVEWTRVSVLNTRSLRYYDLPAGNHTVSIYYQEGDLVSGVNTRFDIEAKVR